MKTKSILLLAASLILAVVAGSHFASAPVPPMVKPKPVPKVSAAPGSIVQAAPRRERLHWRTKPMSLRRRKSGAKRGRLKSWISRKPAGRAQHGGVGADAAGRHSENAGLVAACRPGEESARGLEPGNPGGVGASAAGRTVAVAAASWVRLWMSSRASPSQKRSMIWPRFTGRRPHRQGRDTRCCVLSPPFAILLPCAA